MRVGKPRWFSIFKLEPACPAGAFVSALKRPCWPPQLAGDELLPPVDVVGRTREGRIGHDVYGERGDVGGSYETPDGKRGAKLIAAVFEFIAEERRRQRCVDEA